MASKDRRPAGLPDDAAVLGRMAGENFVVASRLLGARPRRHLVAFYGWARLVDQLGDDFTGDRLGALDWVEAELSLALAEPGRTDLHGLVAAAASSVTELGIGPAPLLDLVAANRMDQTVHAYATFDDLLGYCALSANPVGRLVLAAFDASSPRHEKWSDAICSGLQVVEHLQDVAEDQRAGRCYLPTTDLERFGVDRAALVAAASDPATIGPRPPAALRGLVAHEAARAASLLDEGAPLVGSLRGRARLAVAGFVAGGRAALDAIAGGGYDPWTATPGPRPVRVATHTLSLLRRSGS